MPDSLQQEEPTEDGKQVGSVNWGVVFRCVVAVAVLVAIACTIVKAAQQIRETDFDFSAVGWHWWVAAIFSNGVMLVLSSVFWHRVLIAFGQQPKFGESVLAFFASQLGKYIPGKAMVVVIRTDLIRGPKVSTGAAAASVFVETLTWIFVGSAIASGLLMFEFQGHLGLQLTALGLAMVAGVFTWPPIFRAIANKLGAMKGRRSGEMFAGLGLKTMSVGWMLMALGWCVNGFSLWLVLHGIPGAEVSLHDFWLALACVSLATVAGFVSLLPGGIGVRELVMIPLLGSRFGTVTAVIAAVVIRVVWLLAELLGAGVSYLFRKSKSN